MKPLFFIFAVLLLTSITRADNLYFRNGRVIRNVVFKDSTDKYYIFDTYPVSEPKQVLKSEIYKIEKEALNYYHSTFEDKEDVPEHIRAQYLASLSKDTNQSYAAKDSANDPCQDKVLKQLEAKDSLSVQEMQVYVQLKKMCSEYRQGKASVPSPVIETSYPNMIMLPLGIVGVVVAVKSFIDASDYSDAIDGLKAFRLPTGDLETKRDNKMAIGAISGILGLIFTAVAITPVEVEIKPNQVALNYRYNF